MDEFDEFSEHRVPQLPGQRFGVWVRENRVLILYGLLLAAVMFCRALWGADELGWAELARGPWKPANGIPVLFQWMLKASSIAADALVGGAGSTSGPAAWTLRLPLVVGSIAFLFAFRRWAARFLQPDVAGLGTLILCATPLWFWQSQFIQVDVVFSSVLGWSWLCWLAGYLLLRGRAEGVEHEHRRWFRWSYAWLGLAFLLRGPLPILMSILLFAVFLAWQRDLKALKSSLLGWGLGVVLLGAALTYFRAFWMGGGTLATGTADEPLLQLQPLWMIGLYLLRDIFPWVILLPALVVFLRGSGAHKAPLVRFLMIAFLIPLLFSLAGSAGRGLDPLVAYPFLALLLGGMLQPIYVEGVSEARIRRIGGLLAAGLWLPALAFIAVSGFRLGGLEVQSHLAPILWPLRASALVLLLGALSVSAKCAIGEGEFLVRETAATLCVVYLILGTWGFHRWDVEMRNRNANAGVGQLQRFK